MEQFRQIPLFSTYRINENGAVFSNRTMKMLDGSINPAGYHNFRLTDDFGIVRTMGGHRLVAMTFIGMPTGYESLDVNHINGIKADNRKDNLEWMTRKENVYHAGITGLTEKCIPMQVRRVATGLVITFPSFITAAITLGLTKDSISRRVNAGEHIVDELGFQYRKLDSENDDWCTPLIWQGVSLRNALTGVVTFFNTQLEIANMYGVSMAFISKAINSPNHAIFRMGDGLFQIADYSPNLVWHIYPDPYLEYENNSRYKLIVMYNPIFEKPRIFFTLEEAAAAYGMKKNVPYQRAKINRKEPWHDGLICHYLFNN